MNEQVGLEPAAISIVSIGAELTNILEQHRRHATAEIGSPQTERSPLGLRGQSSHLLIRAYDGLPGPRIIIDKDRGHGNRLQRMEHRTPRTAHSVEWQSGLRKADHTVHGQRTRVDDVELTALQLAEEVHKFRGLKPPCLFDCQPGKERRTVAEGNLLVDSIRNVGILFQERLMVEFEFFAADTELGIVGRRAVKERAQQAKGGNKLRIKAHQLHLNITCVSCHVERSSQLLKSTAQLLARH